MRTVLLSAVLMAHRARLAILVLAFTPFCAPFASTPEPYEAPEGQTLIRDTYQFEGAQHPMTGLTPDSDGPHKLIVMLATIEEVHDEAFAYRSRAIENAVATQGHGVVLVEWPGYNDYPDNAGAAEFFTGELSASRDKICGDWERKATGVIAGINKLCARDDFDCSSGIALTGGSAGAGVAVQVSKLYPGVNALLTTHWLPLLGAGQPVFEAITGPGGGPYLLPPHPLALHWCGFDDTGNNPPTWSTVGDLKNVPADQYPPALSTYVDKSKRLSVIAADDSLFGNPTEDPAAAAPVFSLQRDFSGYDCPDSQHDCTQADGSGYYVIPAGVIPTEPYPKWLAFLALTGQPALTKMTVHAAHNHAFVDDAFIGEKWHARQIFKWLGDAAFGA